MKTKRFRLKLEGTRQHYYASVSLKTHPLKPQVIEPFVVANLNLIHVETCKAKAEEYSREIYFIKNVKESVKTNPLFRTIPFFSMNTRGTRWQVFENHRLLLQSA